MKYQPKGTIVVFALLLAIAPLSFSGRTDEGGAIATHTPEILAQGQPVSTEALFVTHLFDSSGNEMAQIPGVLSQFSPNGQIVVVEPSPGSRPFYLFDITGRKLSEIEASQLWFSPDSQRIVSESALYDATGQQLAELPQNRISAHPLFSPDGQRFIIFGVESAYLFDASGEQIDEIPGIFINTGSRFSATGQQAILYEFGQQARCHLLDSSGRAIAVLPEECAGTTPNGQYFFLGVGTIDDPSLRLYNFSGQEIAQLFGTFPTVNQESRLILTTDFLRGNSSYLYTAMGEPIARLQGQLGILSFNGERIIISEEGVTCLYNDTGSFVAQVPAVDAAFLPGSNSFITLAPEGYVPRESNCSSEALLDSPLVEPTTVPSTQPLEIAPTPGPILNPSSTERNTNPTSNSSGAQNFNVLTRLFDASGREIAILKGRTSGLQLLSRVLAFGQVGEPLVSSFSGDGQRIVTYDAQQSYLYDASGQLIAELQGIAPRFNSTGQRILTDSENTVYLYDRSGNLLEEFEIGESVVFSPDGERIAIAYRTRRR